MEACLAPNHDQDIVAGRTCRAPIAACHTAAECSVLGNQSLRVDDAERVYLRPCLRKRSIECVLVRNYGTMTALFLQ